MEDITNLPIEIGIEKAKRDIVAAINQIGREYSLPSSILFMVVEEVLNSSKNSTYTTIIANYDISIPKAVSEPEPTKAKPVVKATPKSATKAAPKPTDDANIKPVAKATKAAPKPTGDANAAK